MISVSTSYNNIISTGGHYEWQVINGANTYGKDDIVTGTIKTAVYEKLSIGNTIAAELNLTLRGVSGISTSDPLEVQFRAVADALTSAWYTKGIFYIDTIESSPYSEIVQITAFDAMLKSEVDFMPTGSYVPMTSAQVYSQIVTDMGVSSHSATSTWLTNNPVTLSNAPNVGVGGTTDRDMLSYLGIMYVGNWVISPQNELKLVFADLAAANTVTVGDAVQSMDASPSDTVERVKLWLDNSTYYLAPTGITEAQWLALGGICIEAHLPFYATQDLASIIYNAFRLKTYYPYTATGAYIDPKYEVGDGISLDATNPFSSFIASQTLTMDGISPSDAEFKGEEKVNSLYPYVSSVQRDTIYQVSKAQDTADAAQTAASNAQSSANNANYREQIIYRSAASGTNTMSANTTWVTDATGGQNKWTTVRPVYDGSYPVLFVATQRQSVSQSSGTTCTCTTPAKDQTTTVIDGGHITTGTIDAGVVNVTNLNADNIVTGTISDTLGHNSWNLTTGALTITDGSLHITTSSATDDVIRLKTATLQTQMTPDGLITFAIPINTEYWAQVQGQYGSFLAGHGDGTAIIDISAQGGKIACGGNGTTGIIQVRDGTDAITSQIDSTGASIGGKLSNTGQASLGSGYASVANLTAFNNAILTAYSDMSNGQISYLRLAPSASISPFGSYVQFCTIYKINSGYGAVEAVSYRDGDGFVKFTASIWNDAVSTWSRESGNHKFAISTAKTIPIQNYYRGFLVITDSTSSNNGVYIVYVGSTGFVGLVTLHAASNVTLTTSTANQLTITPSSGTRNCLLIDINANATV